MRVIMAPPTKDKGMIQPWVLKELVAGYQLVDFKDEEKLKQIKDAIEPDFEMCLGQQQVEWVNELENLSFVLVTIGQKQISSKVDCYYEMTKGRWENEEVLGRSKSLWISCYSDSQVVASELITTVQEILEKITQRRQRAVIYLDAKSKASYFYHRSLTYKLINNMIGEEHFLLQVMKKQERVRCYLTSDRNYEPYKNKFLYGNSYEQLMQYVIGQLTRQKEETIIYSLYDDFFYECVPMEEKLYVPLIKSWESTGSNLTDLRRVPLGKGQYAIYDTKAHIEAQQEKLKAYVPSQWTLPLAAQIPVYRKQGVRGRDDSFFKSTSSYKGDHVYIGIVTAESVQVESAFLRTAQGNSRISCLWEQEEADRGIYYTGSSIDKRLTQDNTCCTKKTDTTCLLEVAGGKYKEQETLATEANFLVAKIKPASKAIQHIYLGEVQPSTVLVTDLLIATHKLVELAKLNRRPLVLYLPYFYLLGGEGKDIYDRLLEELSDEPGLTIIMPAGEEADKRHHQFITGATGTTFIETRQDRQIIIGVISTKNLVAFTARLQLVGNEEQKVSLHQKGRYETKVGVVETSGLIWDATSGGLTLRFRIVQQQKSKWQLTFKSQDDELLRLRINLKEMTLGPDAMLDTYSALATANVAPSKWSTIGVGSFNTKNLGAMGGSGRIDSSCLKRLTLVAEGGASIWDHETHQVYWIEGSAVAASLVAGAVATLYSKWYSEKGAPYPNTHMMKAWLEKLLIKMPGQDYPHLSQGEGILELRQLEATLMAPLE